MLRVLQPLPVVLVLALVACGGSGSRTPTPGADCLRNSDCQNPLSCSFGRCHEDCKVARDCPQGQMCVIGENETHVCLLPEEESCALNSECPSPLACAQDLKCRNQCLEDRDCATDSQRCVPPGKVCAEPDDIVNGRLRILTPEDGGPDADGATGEDQPPADASTTPEAGATDAATAMDASDTMDAAADGATPIDAQVAPDAGGADSGRDAAPPEPGVELEPNDTREQAQPYTLGTPLAADSADPDDDDYYEISVPAGDLAGGYFQGSITGVGNGAVRALIYDASTNFLIFQATNSTPGSSFFFFWAGGAAQTYHVLVQRQTSPSVSFEYTFEVDYTEIDDPFEPNQTRDEPKPIALGTTVLAYLFSGFVDQRTTQAEYRDWYVIDEELSAGTLDVAILDVTTDFGVRVSLYDSDNTLIDNPSGGLGANVNATFTIATPGVYRLLVEPVILPIDESGTSLTVYDSYTRPYQLTVSQ